MRFPGAKAETISLATRLFSGKTACAMVATSCKMIETTSTRKSQDDSA